MIDSKSAQFGGDTTGVDTGSTYDPYYAVPPDPQHIVAQIQKKYQAWRDLRRPYEIQWYINAAVVRGMINVRWNPVLQKLENAAVPSYKHQTGTNLILPKFRARKAKFLKNKYQPVVVPSSTDKDDRLNALASQKGLEYIARKTKLEQVYKEVVDYALLGGKGFMWVYWDSSAKRNVKDPVTGQLVENAPVGDIVVVPGSPFEILVPDLGVSHIGQQPEFLRVRLEPINQFKLRYADVPNIDEVKADGSAADLFQYQRQIATLGTRSNIGILGGATTQSTKDLDQVTVIEHFEAPCAKYPNGRFTVVAGNKLIRYMETLPYGFANDTNPYPVVEFSDLEFAGQFWPTTTVEQLVPAQREYNYLRMKLSNHLAKLVHPKVIVSAHAKWPKNAWTDEAGEVIRILTPPGVMEPKVVQMPPISQDVWNTLRLVKEEFDVIPTLYAVSQGETSGTTSGFQANLLQEANDSVHAPDIRSHELQFEELYRKIRRMMAQGYTVPRFISAIGRNYIPDVVELVSNHIDENAEIIVMTTNTLSHSPAVRTQQVIELWSSGILQNQQNPEEAKRKAFTLLDSTGLGEFQEEQRRDEEKARLETLAIQRRQPIEAPLPFDDHMIHYTVHTDETKSPAFGLYDPQQKTQLYLHIVEHMKYFNPQQAFNTLNQLGLGQFGPMMFPEMYQPPPPAAAPANQPPSGGVPSQGQPVSAGPQGTPR
jgi:hypothetical protein